MKACLQTIAVSSLTFILGACGEPQAPAPAPEPPKPAAEAPTGAAAPARLTRTAAPAGARVSFVSPANGATVRSPVKVQFALEGMELAPAGTYQPNTGHHHLLIDTGLPDALDQPIVKDEKHLHYGLIQTEAEVPLPPGQHTLQLLLGDGNHIPHDPPVASEQITITVE
jgi:hypothetical protein